MLFGVSPLRDETKFNSYIWKPDSRDGWSNGLNGDIETLFFEGEFGEIFPNLDPEDTGSFDFGFAVGRQQIFFQEGIMFNGIIDADTTTDEQGRKVDLCRFSSPFVQERLYNARPAPRQP